MDYEKDLKIDESSLDLEWLDQASLMLRYARYQAECQMKEEQERERLDLTKSELDLDIRSDPERYKIDVKITESVIMSTILESDQYKEVQKTYTEARFENNVAKGAVRAMDARKTALENLVKLHGQQYFAGPKVPRDLTWERKEKQKKADSVVGNRMRRRT